MTVIDDLKPLSIDEVVALLQPSDGSRGVSTKFVVNRLQARKWPGVKLSNKWHMTRAQVQKALDIESTSPHQVSARPSGLSRRSRAKFEVAG